MFSAGVAVGNVQPYFLTQADVTLDKSKPLPLQPDLAVIEAQALTTGEVLAGFIGAATTSLDIAIYDFRLLDGPLTDQIVGAVKTAARRGVTVRLAYDRTQAPDAILKEFSDADGDPAPVGTHAFIAATGLPASVQVRPIEEEAIDPGHQIMHHKYIVRDAGRPDAAVLMGSANFTTDAWGIQDNNVLVITAAPDLAAAYERDFADLWSAQRLAGTGTGDAGHATAAGIDIGYSFAPGEGTLTENNITTAIASARTRIRVASMVISSGEILQALADQIAAGLDVAGIYDGPEMTGIIRDWGKGAPGSTSAQHLTLWQTIAQRLTAKASEPFTATGPHNFMHNKIVVADSTTSTGSFNLSANATRNAENVLQITNPDLADQYATYIESLTQRYR